MEVWDLKAYSDSLVVIEHVKDDYVAQELNMMKYLQRVEELNHAFDRFKIQQISREKNSRADSLAKAVNTILMELPREIHF